MTFRSTTTVAKTFWMYAPLIPAYHTNAARAATLVTTKPVVSGERDSVFGRARAAMPRSAGRIPIPIESAPNAQTPWSKTRSL